MHYELRDTGHLYSCGMKVWSPVLHSTAVRSVFTTNQPSVTDNNGPLSELQLNNNVEVPENSVQVNDSTMEEISQAVDPFTEDGNHGINLFVTLVNFLGNKQ